MINKKNNSFRLSSVVVRGKKQRKLINQKTYISRDKSENMNKL